MIRVAKTKSLKTGPVITDSRTVLANMLWCSNYPKAAGHSDEKLAVTSFESKKRYHKHVTHHEHQEAQYFKMAKPHFQTLSVRAFKLRFSVRSHSFWLVALKLFVQLKSLLK